MNEIRSKFRRSFSKKTGPKGARSCPDLLDETENAPFRDVDTTVLLTVQKDEFDCQSLRSFSSVEDLLDEEHYDAVNLQQFYNNKSTESKTQQTADNVLMKINDDRQEHPPTATADDLVNVTDDNLFEKTLTDYDADNEAGSGDNNDNYDDGINENVSSDDHNKLDTTLIPNNDDMESEEPHKSDNTQAVQVVSGRLTDVDEQETRIELQSTELEAELETENRTVDDVSDNIVTEEAEHEPQINLTSEAIVNEVEAVEVACPDEPEGASSIMILHPRPRVCYLLTRDHGTTLRWIVTKDDNNDGFLTMTEEDSNIVLVTRAFPCSSTYCRESNE